MRLRRLHRPNLKRLRRRPSLLAKPLRRWLHLPLLLVASLVGSKACLAAMLPSRWLLLRSRKTKSPAKAAEKVVAKVAANRVVMAAVVVAEANAAKAPTTKFVPPAKVDAEVKDALTHAQRPVQKVVLKVVKAMPARLAVIAQSVASAMSVQHARAAKMLAVKAAPMPSQS